MRLQALMLTLVILLVLPMVNATQGHLKLLAVSESEAGYKGSIADLYAELKEGNGRVFIDTFPVTKSDTQISTRFAKEIVCDFLDMDCSSIDFIYTIKADSAIIGGPSAGAAIAVLTTAMLKGLEPNEKIAITGSINSGGLIGPVGGLKSKVDAAASDGIEKVLIPKGERFVQDDELLVDFSEDLVDMFNETVEETKNRTIDIIEYGRRKGLEVKEVSTLNEAVYEFTGELLEEPAKDLSIDSSYKETMMSLADLLCNRSRKLSDNIQEFDITNKTQSHIDIEKDAKNMTERSKQAFREQRYYSSASYCYGANVKYGYLLLYLQNFSNEEFLSIVYSMKEKLQNLSISIERQEIKSITDLETYMVVKERMIEAEEYLDDSMLNINDSQQSFYQLAYGTERIYSVFSWSKFFGSKEGKFSFNMELLKESCLRKISESEERYQYFSLFYPGLLESTRKEINYAYEDMNNGDYELCLFKASKAKASANVILSVMGMNEDQIRDALEIKLGVIKNNIAKSTEEMFPILGYSYYEYAESLKDSDMYSALLYSEYALELSNLGIYFKERKNVYSLDILKISQIDTKVLYALLFGLCFGFLFAYTVRLRRKRSREKKLEIKIR